MATLHVRQFPDSLHRRLAKLAERDRRSLGAEVVVLLEREIRRVRDFTQVRNRIRRELARKRISVTEEQLFDEIS